MERLILRQRRPHEQTYVIAGPTHIGRKENGKWHVTGRAMPEEFRTLDAAIVIHGDSTISRNHAGILPHNDGYDLIDLNSKNGTRLNGQSVRRRRLRPGDSITIGQLDLVVDDAAAEISNYALFIGHNGGNLRGVQNDVQEISAELRARGFRTAQLLNGQATKKHILAEIEYAAHRLCGDSHFLLHYSGHGLDEGIMLGTERMTPEELYEPLWNVRGKKAIVLDSCHSGTFLSANARSYIPPNTLVVTASSEENLAYETDNQGLRMGRLSAALLQFLKEHRGQLNLKEFRTYIKENIPYDRIKLSFQDPQVTGNTFTLMTAYTQRDPDLSASGSRSPRG